MVEIGPVLIGAFISLVDNVRGRQSHERPRRLSRSWKTSRLML